MYVARTFTASATDDVELAYACGACGKTSLADVIVLSRGSAEAPFMIGQGDARASAAHEAVAGLARAAHDTVGLAGCKCCGARDPVAVRNARIGAAFAALASGFGVAGTIVALVAAIVALSASAAGTKVVASLVALFAFALPILMVASSRVTAAFREASSRVTWRG